MRTGLRRLIVLAGCSGLALWMAPAGIAADSIYWTNQGDNTVRVGSLSCGGASNLFTEPAMSGPAGVAINPATGKIYWTDEAAGGNNIRVANLDGTGTASTLFTEPMGSG